MEFHEKTESENKRKRSKTSGLVYGILDLLMLTFLFLPLYGQPEGDLIRHVSLFHFEDISLITRAIFMATPISLAILGVVEVILQLLEQELLLTISKIASLFLHITGILAFALTRQPYGTALFFLFFIIKLILIKKVKLKS